MDNIQKKLKGVKEATITEAAASSKAGRFIGGDLVVEVDSDDEFFNAATDLALAQAVQDLEEPEPAKAPPSPPAALPGPSAEDIRMMRRTVLTATTTGFGAIAASTLAVETQLVGGGKAREFKNLSLIRHTKDGSEHLNFVLE